MRAVWVSAALFLLLGAGIWLQSRGPSRRAMAFPAGVTLVHSEILVPAGTEVAGVPGKSVLRAASDFRGRGLLVVSGGGVRIRDLAIEGNRDSLEARPGLPGSDVSFARFTRNNGVLAVGVAGLRLSDIAFREIAGFAVLVSASRDILIQRVSVRASGSRNALGRNNTTGGILIEEGSLDFRVENCELFDIRGNGIWTHSLYTSRRNARGVFAGNRLERVGRDALQAGHATEMRIERNQGSEIGFPVADVDMEALAVPVAVDTAGNVDSSAYVGNVFREVNGKCIDLDGFHDGVVRGNVCINRRESAAYPFGGYGIVMNNSNPDMQSRNVGIEDNVIDGAKFGGIFVIGETNVVTGNRLLNLNLAHYGVGQPDLLRAGVFLGSGAERPAEARGNVIERNIISGWRMDSMCVRTAPSVDPGSNTVRWNNCYSSSFK